MPVGVRWIKLNLVVLVFFQKWLKALGLRQTMETLLNSIMYVNVPMVALFKDTIFWNYLAISFL